MKSYTAAFESPLGHLWLVSDGEVLTGLYFEGQKNLPSDFQSWERNQAIPPFPQVIHQLKNYFSGNLCVFELPFMASGTPFQKRVWSALEQLPFGLRKSYSELATQMGIPSSVRAVAAALARNPISIIIPCHRVVGQDGSLRGYAGGLDRKRRLLEMEEKAVSVQGGPPDRI